MNILQINGSARSEAGNSTRIASDIVACCRLPDSAQIWRR